MSTATIQRKRSQAEELKNQSEALERKAEEVQQRESELEDEADKLNTQAYKLDRDEIPAMIQSISYALSRLISLDDDDRNSLARRQEDCRAQAKNYLGIAERLIREASRKRSQADLIWGKPGADERDGIQAAQLGEEAVRLETEALVAVGRAEESNAEACRLRRLDLSRWSGLEQERTSLRTRIDNKRQEVNEARDRFNELKTEEGRLRAEEGVHCNNALDILEESKNAMEEARKLHQEADDMENQIREDENLSSQ